MNTPQQSHNEQKQKQQDHTKIVILKENRDVQIRPIDEDSRGIFWAPIDGRTLAKATVLRLEPEVIVPNAGHIKHCCHVCFAKEGRGGGALECCSDCRLVRYCSYTCKAADSLIHQRECKALCSIQMDFVYQGIGPLPPPAPVDPGTKERMVGRLIWLRQQRGPEWWKPIEALKINAFVQYPEVELVELSKYISGSVNDWRLDLWSRLRLLGLPKDIDEVRDIYTRVVANAHRFSYGGEEVGLALNSTAAMLNYSFDSNVAITFPLGLGVKDCMHVVALKDIKAGDELCIDEDAHHAGFREEFDVMAAFLRGRV